MKKMGFLEVKGSAEVTELVSSRAKIQTQNLQRQSPCS